MPKRIRDCRSSVEGLLHPDAAGSGRKVRPNVQSAGFRARTVASRLPQLNGGIAMKDSDTSRWATARRALLAAATAAAAVAQTAAQTTGCRYEVTVGGQKYSGVGTSVPIIFNNPLCPGNVTEENTNRYWRASVNCSTLPREIFASVLASVHEHAKDFPPYCGVTAQPLFPGTGEFNGRGSNFLINTNR